MGIWLSLRVYLVRLMLTINDILERRQKPTPSSAQSIVRITSSSKRGYTLLHFYGTLKDGKGKRPVVLDIHGGGFTSDRPAMDARFIDELLALPCRPVVAAVQYSLCPESPFRSGVEDVAAAIRWLSHEGAKKYNLDADRIVVVGFSAGAGLALTSSFLLHDTGVQLKSPLKGIVAIYPNLDSRIPREPSNSAMLGFLYSVWDECYRSRSPVDSPYVSAAAARDEDIQQALPDRIALYPAADDPYVTPTEAFRTRLLALGKTVSGFVELNAAHAWDKRVIKPGTSLWHKRQLWFSRIAQDVEAMLT